MRGCNFTRLHYFILVSSAYPKFDLLPSANEVWAKVMFSQVLSVHRGVSVWRGLGGGMVVSVQGEGGLCSGGLRGLCQEQALSRGRGVPSPGGSLSRGSLWRRVSVKEGSLWRGLCKRGGLCEGGFCDRGQRPPPPVLTWWLLKQVVCVLLECILVYHVI